MATGSAATTGTMGDWVKNVFLENELEMTVLAIVIAAVVAWLVVTQKSPGSKSRLNLPPGPLNLPLVGAIFSMEANLGEWYKKMAKNYGKIFYYRVGSNGVLFVCSSEGAEEVLKTKDLQFANRPSGSFMKTATKYLGFDGSDVFFNDYNDKHKNLKKLLSVHVFNVVGQHRFEIFRRREGAYLMEDIQRQMNLEGAGISVDKCIFGLAMNVICSIIFGRRHADSLSSETDQLKHCPDIIRTGHTLVLQLNYGDVFPWLAWTDYLGLSTANGFKELNQLCHRVFGQSVEDRKEERKTRKGSPDRDILDVLLTLHDDGKISDNGIFGSLLNMITGGTESNAVTSDWAMRELLKNPDCLKTLQKELDEVVGKERPVEESDFPKLRYLEAVTLEVLRLHPIAPILVPHFGAEATTLQGFYIPPETTVFVHVGIIGRDPLNWEDPEKFTPERFMNLKEKVSAEGTLFALLPFSSGRRKCPGSVMALLTVKRIIATLVHAFDWSPPPGTTKDDIDMTDVLTVLSRPVTPLWLRAKLRVNPAVYAQVLVEQ